MLAFGTYRCLSNVYVPGPRDRKVNKNTFLSSWSLLSNVRSKEMTTEYMCVGSAK